MTRRYEYVGSRKAYPQPGGWRYNRTRELLFITCDDCKCWIPDEVYATVLPSNNGAEPSEQQIDVCPKCMMRRYNSLTRNKESSPGMLEKLVRLQELMYELQQLRDEEERGY
jgi:hypothetical protein